MPERADHDVRIALPPKFDFGWALGFLAARTVPALESIVDGSYRRSVRLDGKAVTFALTPARVAGRNGSPRGERWLVATARPTLPPETLRGAVRSMLDLDADLAGFHRLARGDALLGRIVGRRSGIRMPQLLDPFEGLVRGILGQQVSVAGASTLTDRLVRLFAHPVRGARDTGFLAFPTAADVAGAGADRLRGLGLTRVRASTLAGAAARIADGRLDFHALRRATPADAQAALEDLPGIGPWTASYVRMRALGDRDAFPAADLGVIKALAALGVERRSIVGVAEGWRPWRGYATLHLWASL